MSWDGPSSRPTLCCPFMGTVLGVQGSESTAGSWADVLLEQVSLEARQLLTATALLAAVCCVAFAVSPSQWCPTYGQSRLREVNGSVRVSAAPEAEAGARPRRGAGGCGKVGSRSAQGTGSSGGVAPGLDLPWQLCTETCAPAQGRERWEAEAEAWGWGGGRGMGSWGDHRTGLHRLLGVASPVPWVPCSVCKEIGRPQSRDSMLKSGSPPFGSLGDLGSHIADSPMERAGAGSLPSQFSHSKPVPSPRPACSRRFSYDPPGSPSSLSVTCSRAWGWGWQRRGGCRTG